MHKDPVLSYAGPIPIRTYAPDTPSRGAVLVYHGLRSSMDVMDREARALADAGMTAILVDAPHHGWRHSDVVGTMPDALSLPGHYVLLRLLREARDEFPALVDHVMQAGHARVAVAGVSFGAFIALAAATIEPRLVAIASVMGSPDWTPRDGVVPEDLVAVVAESPLVRLPSVAPRPLLLVNGALDDNVRPDGARALAAKLAPVYEGRAPLVHREYPDVSHFPSEDVWRDMWWTAAQFLADEFAKLDDDRPKPMEAPPPVIDPGRYEGPARAAPYPLTRTSPTYDLVDVAAQIQRADQTLAAMTGGKLGVIAEQIQRLQDQARALLEKARRDAELHRAACSFEKKPGGEYHLYKKKTGELWFSRLAPDEWVTPQPQTFEGTYRLELDMSFTRIDIGEEAPAVLPLAALGR